MDGVCWWGWDGGWRVSVLDRSRAWVRHCFAPWWPHSAVLCRVSGSFTQSLEGPLTPGRLFRMVWRRLAVVPFGAGAPDILLGLYKPWGPKYAAPPPPSNSPGSLAPSGMEGRLLCWEGVLVLCVGAVPPSPPPHAHALCPSTCPIGRTASTLPPPPTPPHPTPPSHPILCVFIH